jgi:6-phosphofructokinase 2
VAKTVIIARGAEGNVLADKTQRLFSRAAKVRVKSTVGAGDSFVAAFVLALARGQSNAEALALGSAAASAAVTTDATQLCRPEDVMRLLPECAVTEV